MLWYVIATALYSWIVGYIWMYVNVVECECECECSHRHPKCTRISLLYSTRPELLPSLLPSSFLLPLFFSFHPASSSLAAVASICLTMYILSHMTSKHFIVVNRLLHTHTHTHTRTHTHSINTHMPHCQSFVERPLDTLYYSSQPVCMSNNLKLNFFV